MGKFNSPASTESIPGKTTNVAGGISFERPTIKHDIASIILTSMLSGDKYYESQASETARLEALFAEACQTEPEYLAKAMVFARTAGKLRSISHMAAVILAENVNKQTFLRHAFRDVIQRVDDMTEIVALWNSRHKKSNGMSQMPPNALIRGIRDVFELGKKPYGPDFKPEIKGIYFDEFQFSRYKGTGNVVKLKDIIKLVHPKPVGYDDKKLLQRIVTDNLKVADTLETKRSAGTGTKEAVADLVKKKKLGYMATLKNIRNALVDGIDEETLGKMTDFIENPKAIRNSRVLPFRYWDAWKALKNANVDQFSIRKVKSALDKALGYSAVNLELIKPAERIAVIVDCSGSMVMQQIGNHYPYTVGRLLAGALIAGIGKENVIYYEFDHKCYDKSSEMNESVLDFVASGSANGGATHFDQPFGRLIMTKTKVDKIIIFTDLQLYRHDADSWYGGIGRDNLLSYLDEYRTVVQNNAKLLFWTLADYDGGTPIRLGKGITEVSGFSDAIIPFVAKIFDNPNYMVEQIEAVKL